MLFNSIHFLCFFPVVVLIYFAVPQRAKNLWLLAASYYFYMSWNPRYILLLLTSTVITYVCGRLLGRYRSLRARRTILVSGLVSNLGILFYFKYFGFFMDSVNGLLQALHVQVIDVPYDVLLPVGISFYTFQALGYLIDVYRGDTAPQKNFLEYALFVSFFPQLVAGPIERSGNLLRELKQPHHFHFENMREGLLLMLWGYFLKLVIADRAAIFVDAVYGNLGAQSGAALLTASVLFSFQIYGDFAGYSTIAIGAAKILDIQLMENFNAPYFADSVADFWRRWHISLSSWFKDYLYIPLGGNRKGRARRYLNLLIVFAVSGLWHGAAATYIVWGLINGALQVIGDICRPVKAWLVKTLKVNVTAASHTIGKIFVTFWLINTTWIFFRAKSFADAMAVIGGIVGMATGRAGMAAGAGIVADGIGTSTVGGIFGGVAGTLAAGGFVASLGSFFDGSLLQLGLNGPNFAVLVLALVILMIADFAKYRGVKVRGWIIAQGLWLRWAIYLAAIFAVLIFGVYGSGYKAANFIYFQF